MVQANMVVAGDPPVATMPRDAAFEAFYGTCGAKQAAWGVERIGPQPLVPFVTLVSLGDGALGGPPRYYVVARQDRAIPPSLQRRMARERATTDVAELDTDHSPFLSGSPMTHQRRCGRRSTWSTPRRSPTGSRPSRSSMPGTPSPT